MSDDLVKRLREDQPVTQDMVSTMQCDLQNEAADRIEELEANVADLRESLVMVHEVGYRNGQQAAKAGLAKALEALQYMVNHASQLERNEGIYWEATEIARTTIAKLKGQDDG